MSRQRREALQLRVLEADDGADWYPTFPFDALNRIGRIFHKEKRFNLKDPREKLGLESVEALKPSSHTFLLRDFRDAAEPPRLLCE
jgi:hypothetical protein